MLKDKLFEDLKDAMKNKNKVKKNTIQLVRNAIMSFEKDNKVELSDDKVLDIISKEVKKRKDSMPDFEKSGRDELLNELKEEIELLMTYLPEQMTEEEIEKVVIETIGQVSATSMADMGKVMGAMMPKTRGKADNKIVNMLVKKHLS